MVVNNFGAISSWMGGFWETIKGYANAGFNVLKTIFGWTPLGMVVNNFGAISSWMGGFWETIKGYANAGFNVLKTIFGWTPLGMVVNNFGAISSWMGGFWETIKGYANAGFNVLKTIFGWTPLGLITNNFNGIVAFFTGLPAKFMSLGEMTMDGLVKGITNKLASVKEAIYGAGSGAISWFKETLGIASPSKVFATMGDQTMQGLNVGINRSQGEPLKQVRKVGKAMAGTAMVVGATSMPAAAKPAFVSGSQLKQPTNVQTAAKRQSQPVHIDASINAPITIYASPGMDTQEIARQVALQMEAYQRQQQAKLRSKFGDIE